MNLDLARIAARDLAAEFVKPFQSLNPKSNFPQLTLAELLFLGAHVAKTIATYWKTHGKIREELDFVCRTFDKENLTQANIEEFFYQQIGSGQVTAEEIRSMIDYLARFIASPVLQRQLLTQAKDEIAPPGLKGSPGKIAVSEYPHLASRSAQFVGPMKRFLELAGRFPSKSEEELIGFIASDYVEDAAVLVQYQSTIKAVRTSGEFSKLKFLNTRAQYLADVAAGTAYSLAPESAHDYAEQGRRMTKRHKGGN
jgi:hypothetical protein